MKRMKAVFGILVGLAFYVPAVKGGFSPGVQLLLAETGSAVLFYFAVKLLTSFKDQSEDRKG